jgi:predicted glycogen debranching enzyme
MRNEIAPVDRRHEWLETDGLGGFAMGTTSGIRTRRYHGLLCAATAPPAGRMMLVNAVEAWVSGPGTEGSVALGSHLYGGGVVHPDGVTRLKEFRLDPWPTWTYGIAGELELEHEVFMTHGAPIVTLAWRPNHARVGWTLHVRPLLSGRDFHALHHENPAFRFDTAVLPAPASELRWQPYVGVPGVFARSSGEWVAAPEWYRRFAYEVERERGLDWQEDLASPGVWSFDLARGEACVVLAADVDGAHDRLGARGEAAGATVRRLREAERARRAVFTSPLARAADAYLVRRGGGSGRTVIAGYPWFGEWGRDTFIAMRGLLLTSGRLREARDLLVEWAGLVSEGMLPNRFPDVGVAPEYNSVDAALWYVVAVDEWLRATGALAAVPDRSALERAIDQIVEGYAAGTRFRIGMGEDGLLAAGVDGVQLTWMDAKVDGRVITPRIGKPVEIQALWIRALEVAGRRDTKWAELAAKVRVVFARRFWNEPLGWLNDVVDVDHVPGTFDASLRPNQLFAIGGLGEPLVAPSLARRALDAVERELWTPLGPRTLSPRHPDYGRRCAGGVVERDEAYHQGTVWPWLAGPFVEAWLRAHGGAGVEAARQTAYGRFVAELLLHLGDAGLDHVSEIADAEAPHEPRGCPFQAWSVGELVRVLAML